MAEMAEKMEARFNALDRQITDGERELGDPVSSQRDLTLEDRARANSRDGQMDQRTRRVVFGSGDGYHEPDGSHRAFGGRSSVRHTGLRGQALTINERATTVPDAARQRVALALEADPDPEFKLARYVIATGDEDYASAFRKWLRDPLSGHYEWTPQERDAYAHAQAEARAMNLGTTTAGGFLVSYELRAHAKTAAGARAVPLAPDIARRLRVRRLGSPYSLDHQPGFASLRGTHIDAPNWRNQAWNPAREAAGLPWATTHTLRHSLASLLLENGHTIEQIAAWLGHEDSAFTLRTYVHTRDVGSADFLDDFLGGASSAESLG